VKWILYRWFQTDRVTRSHPVSRRNRSHPVSRRNRSHPVHKMLSFQYKLQQTLKTKAMNFEKGYLYHIYNQGNNRQKIFYCRENYLFFLKKIEYYIKPYSDILSWCLMPNHFHIMILVNELELNINHEITRGRSISKTRNLNDSMAILLRSYTRALNRQEDRNGSLFRESTKADCINCFNGTNPSHFMNNGITQITFNLPEKQYPQVCFDYIHLNPLKAKLVKKAVDWEFSSARDYAGLRDGKLINKKIAEEYIDISTELFDEINR
jgi:putative transposase